MATISIQMQLLGTQVAGAFLQSKSTLASVAAGNAIAQVADAFRVKLVEYAQSGHPEHPNVISGNLSGHMNAVPEGELTWRVGAGAYYAPFVEYGHMSRSWGGNSWHPVPAYPFFRPAVVEIFDSGAAQRMFQTIVQGELG